MKTCTKCGEAKPLEEYAKSRIHKDDKRPNCKQCDAAYYAANKEQKVAAVHQYRRDNREAILARRRRNHAAKNPRPQGNHPKHDSHVKAFRKEQRNWRCNDHRLKNKPYYAAAASKRRAVARNAEPVWADSALIKLLYTTRQYLTEQTGEEWHIDHAVPLQGRNVCGLHVHFNLRVVPAKFNQAKGNKFAIN
jgi:hypothetical protein